MYFFEIWYTAEQTETRVKSFGFSKASITVVSGNSRSSGELIAWNICFVLLKIKVFRFFFRLYDSEHNDLNFGNDIPRLRFLEIHLNLLTS